MRRIIFWGGLILAFLFAVNIFTARLIKHYDPYHKATINTKIILNENPALLNNLNTYSEEAARIRDELYLEQAHNVASKYNWFREQDALNSIIEIGSLFLKLNPANIHLVLSSLDSVAQSIITFDTKIANLQNAADLEWQLSSLAYQADDATEAELSNIAQNSEILGNTLQDVSEAINFLGQATETLARNQHTNSVKNEIGKLREATADNRSFINSWSPIKAYDIESALHAFSLGLEAWQQLPDSLYYTRDKMNRDTAVLHQIENEYYLAKITNDRLGYDKYRAYAIQVFVHEQRLLAFTVIFGSLAMMSWLSMPRRLNLSLPSFERTSTHRGQSPAPSSSLHGSFIHCQYANGREQAQLLPLNGRLSIGSSPLNDVHTSPEQSIPNHAMIKRARTRYFLDSCHRNTPIWLNGRQINGARALSDGDIIQLADVRLTFHQADM